MKKGMQGQPAPSPEQSAPAKNAGPASPARAALHLAPGRERSLERRHPWIFSGAVKSIQGKAAPGDVVRVDAANGRFLGWGAFSPASQIRCRILSFDEARFPDEVWLHDVVAAAVARRHGTVTRDAMRLVHAESDGLPGVVADRYGDWVVLQLLSAGAERQREAIAAALAEVTGCANVFERSDADVRALEGLAERIGVLRGSAPSMPVVITENGISYQVDLHGGQKTGFYLDQRDNRACIRALSAGRDVLNAFAYTGGFTLAARAGGASSVLSIESSEPAVMLARQNAALNGLDPGEWLQADVFATLRSLRAAGRSFDLIVLDPPKFAPTAHQAQSAARGYKDINLNAMRLLRPGGLLATFSCSGGVSPELFQKIVAGAAADAGASLTIERRFQAAADHPVLVEFPEGEYLKGLLLRRR
jgi:23S rRNA (cytosine1962-C5)-methyltransferase